MIRFDACVVIASNPQQAEELRACIAARFETDRAWLVNQSPNTDGLRVSVS